MVAKQTVSRGTCLPFIYVLQLKFLGWSVYILKIHIFHLSNSLKEIQNENIRSVMYRMKYEVNCILNLILFHKTEIIVRSKAQNYEIIKENAIYHISFIDGVDVYYF